MADEKGANSPALENNGGNQTPGIGGSERLHDQQQDEQQTGMREGGPGNDPVAGGAHGGEMDAGSQAEQQTGSGR